MWILLQVYILLKYIIYIVYLYLKLDSNLGEMLESLHSHCKISKFPFQNVIHGPLSIKTPRAINYGRTPKSLILKVSKYKK